MRLWHFLDTAINRLTSLVFCHLPDLWCISVEGSCPHTSQIVFSAKYCSLSLPYSFICSWRFLLMRFKGVFFMDMSISRQTHKPRPIPVGAPVGYMFHHYTLLLIHSYRLFCVIIPYRALVLHLWRID